MPNPSFARVKEVFEQWAMYDAVVQADYMHHNELAATLADWARKQTEPLRIVDLGCGDAWLATHAFREANVAQYRGVDVSDSAVERAREHVTIWPGRAEVVGRQSGRLSAPRARRVGQHRIGQLLAPSLLERCKDRTHCRVPSRAARRRHVRVDRRGPPRR